MNNKTMEHRLQNGDCHDVNVIGTEVELGVWKLANFMDDVDYVDARSEMWIMSIGRHKKTGEFFAATDARYIDNDDYYLVWLR